MMQARRYNRNEIESILERIRNKLIQQTDKNEEGYMELDEGEEVLLKFRTKKTAVEKKMILEELAGSGLQYGLEFIEEAIQLANRDSEEDREDIDFG